MGLVAFELPPSTLEARSYHTVPSPDTWSSSRWRSRGNPKSAIGGLLFRKGVSVATWVRREWWRLACGVHRDGYIGRLLRPLYAAVEPPAHSQLQVLVR